MGILYKFIVVVVLLLAIDSRVESSAEIMREFSVKFGKSLSECLKELDLPKSITDDFYDYWKLDFVITNRDTGCVIACLATKLGVHLDGRLHKENAKEFALKHGADESMANKLVDILHTCESATSEIDECIKVMSIANCFKVEVHKLNWAPTPEVLAGEFLADK